jgi:homoserine O-acetyltransferase
MTLATKFMTLEGPFKMHRGGFIESPTLAYETWGELNEAKDNAILIFTGLSPSAHAASSGEDQTPGWWENMIGEDLPLDTDKYCVICINSLGSCFGSTGPASVNPATGERYGIAFPTLSLEDVAEAAYQVVRRLGIERVHTVIGCSMGGMSGLAMCVKHPDAVAGFISISSSARPLPWAIAMRSLQRELIRSDPKWQGGHYDPDDPPITGQRLARKLGMISYRSPEEWEKRFGRERVTDVGPGDEPFRIEFSVESYMENHANKFSGAFDANCYLYLSRASDLFSLAEHGGSLENGFRRLKLERALVIGTQTDILFPIHQQHQLADGIRSICKDTWLVELDSIQGHDAFLVDMDSFRPVICDFLECAGRFSESPSE